MRGLCSGTRGALVDLCCIDCIAAANRNVGGAGHQPEERDVRSPSCGGAWSRARRRLITYANCKVSCRSCKAEAAFPTSDAARTTETRAAGGGQL